MASRKFGGVRKAPEATRTAARLARLWAGLSRRRAACIAGVGAFSFVLNLVLGIAIGVPPPSVHDEFAYLVLSDTFAHGRLTNPPHPMWEHFETIQVIQRPTYTAKYPPGQGLALAAGQAIADWPILGVWMVTALACGAMTWMLYAWVPPRWALLGGMLCAIHPLVLEWGRSYWGGSVALLGGALLFGAMRRMIGPQRAQVGHGMALGAGLGVLAFSRPLEGAVVSIAAAGALVACWWRQGTLARRAIRSLWPAIAVVCVALVFLGFYNYGATSDALRLPYSEYEHQYGAAPLFVFLPPKEMPAYRHESIREHHLGVRVMYERQRTWPGFWSEVFAVKLRQLATPHIGLMVLAPMLLLPWVWRRRWVRFAAATLAALLVVLILELTVWAHYAAPAGALIVFLTTMGLRRLRAPRMGGRRAGRWAFRVVVIGAIAASAVWASSEAARPLEGPHVRRAEIEQALTREAAPALVLVRYGPDHDVNFEWVYNAADIDSSPVVWAHDMGPAKNRELLRYYPKRSTWLLEVTATSATLHRLSETAAGAD